MDPVKRICDENEVSREEALYYLEGFRWKFDLAMEACRTKTLPSVTDKSSTKFPVNEKSVSAPPTPPQMMNNSFRISNRKRILPEQQPPMWIMPEQRSPMRIMPEKQPPRSKNELIEAFCMVALGSSPEDAVAYLNRYNWVLDTAVSYFMDEHRPLPGKSNSQGISEDHIPMYGQKYLPCSLTDEISAAVAMTVMKDRASPLSSMALPSPSQFHTSAVYREQDYLKEGKLGSSSCSMDIDPTETEKSLKEAGEEQFPVAIPLMASSQAKIQNIQGSRSPARIREETLSPLMETRVDAALDACRSKILPPNKETSSPGGSVSGESAEVINSSWSSNQLPNLLEQPSQLKNKLICSFCDVAVGSTRGEAIAYLTLCNWDVNQAVSHFHRWKYMEKRVPSLSSMKLPSQSHFQASHGSQNRGYLEYEIGSSSSSMNPYPTKTGRSLKEAGEENVTDPGIASSKVGKKWKGKAVEEDSSTVTFSDPFAIQDRIVLGPRAAAKTITLSILLAGSRFGTPVNIPFRTNQTVRDICNAIEELTEDKNRDYHLTSMTGLDYRDLNTTVQKISASGSTTLIQIFPDPQL